ncbi:hypothetical protein [Alicyclobacillus dauci]|uniref:Uncharacterized protein n=1 Tax=Alicyclobacillus dauci TaxID=1475485 RepID=A0ABY6YZY9_9BACL|nr:hypothetical protein [Alicyclobacillus dauci]WAH35838.1 hypothetical protein NZD86_16410 [Alicyclobacillus dauci]
MRGGIVTSRPIFVGVHMSLNREENLSGKHSEAAVSELFCLIWQWYERSASTTDGGEDGANSDLHSGLNGASSS